MSTQQTVTGLLQRWNGGEAGAFDELMEVVYNRLHRLAVGQARRERHPGVLQATAILHEAILRLLDLDAISWRNRAHFYATTARMMRRIVIDHARAQRCLKRGGDHSVEVTLEEAAELGGPGRPPDLLALEEALSRLESRDADLARVVELKFFAGLSGEEIAHCLDLSRATVQRRWQRARTWLYLDLSGGMIDG